MKRGIATCCAIGLGLGVFGCKKPVYHGAGAETDAATEPDQAASPAEESAPLSPRDKILALREGHIGRTFRDLKINGTAYGDGSVVRIDDDGVRLRVETGEVDFAWADLPAPLREMWGHDPSTAPLPAVAEVAEVAEADPPAPKALDPRTQARVLALESQIAKLSENLENARTTIEEAQAFHSELVAIHEAEDKKAAAMKAARIYARMRRSSCGG